MLLGVIVFSLVNEVPHGVYLNFAAGVALKAPNVRLANRDQASLDHPSLAISSGVIVALF